MAAPSNILFIMCDQLRFDYLGCCGHPFLRTPNLDALAARGVRFTRAYVQSPICGPSRMSFYTGRYMRSHGSSWNGFPLRVGEPTLGDHLRALGVRNVLVGKTHMAADSEGLARLGIEPASAVGVHLSECGFEPYERDDGLHPAGRNRPPYDEYLRARGFAAANPWQEWASSAEGTNGEVLRRLAARPCRQAGAHPRGAFRDALHDPARHGLYRRGRARRPAVVPAPVVYQAALALYRALALPRGPRFGRVLPAVRAAEERADPHPVYAALMAMRAARNFSRDEVRARVIPAYMGLIKQIDDQLGVLFRFLDERQLTERTTIVFTSDHGDYLGDHWLGEKDFFHDCAVKVPLIVVDPRPYADAARGTASDALVEAIDLVSTFVEYFGGEAKPHVLEGRSLTPLLRGEAPARWRQHIFSEYDYAMLEARLTLNQPIGDCRLFMVFDGHWKYVHATGFRPMLFDLERDPREFHDLGADPRLSRRAVATARGTLRLGAARPQPDHDAGSAHRDVCRRPAAAIGHSDRLLGRGRAGCGARAAWSGLTKSASRSGRANRVLCNSWLNFQI